MIKKQIIAIGGSGFQKTRNARQLIIEIIEQTQKKNPKNAYVSMKNNLIIEAPL